MRFMESSSSLSNSNGIGPLVDQLVQ